MIYAPCVHADLLMRARSIRYFFSSGPASGNGARVNGVGGSETKIRADLAACAGPVSRGGPKVRIIDLRIKIEYSPRESESTVSESIVSESCSSRENEDVGLRRGDERAASVSGSDTGRQTIDASRHARTAARKKRDPF